MIHFEQGMTAMVEFLKYVVATLLSVLKYSSWPMLVLFIAIYYKKIFENMIKRTSKFGWGSAEIEFRAALDDLDGQSDEDSKDYNLIKTNPDLAILDSFKEFELTCEVKYTDIYNRILERQSPDEDTRYRSFRRPVTSIMLLLPIFQKMNVLSVLDIEAVSTLRRLRNSVVHLDMEVTENDAKRYINQCKELTDKISAFQIDDGNFDEIYKYIRSDERLSRMWQIN